jgi:hypothetical protein
VQRATLSNLEKELQPTERHEAEAYAEVKRIKLAVLLNELGGNTNHARKGSRI